MSEMATEYKRRPFTVEEYHRMAEVGIFGPEERVELIDGELIEMAPIGNRHWALHALIVHYLTAALDDRAFVVPQGSFPLDRRSEPQPDVAILAPRDYYARGLDSPAEIFALVEVADISSAFDLGRKQQLYASRGIRDYLVTDIGRNGLMCFAMPGDLAYAERRELTYGDTFELAALPGIRLDADPFLAPHS